MRAMSSLYDLSGVNRLMLTPDAPVSIYEKKNFVDVIMKSSMRSIRFRKMCELNSFLVQMSFSFSTQLTVRRLRNGPLLLSMSERSRSETKPIPSMIYTFVATISPPPPPRIQRIDCTLTRDDKQYPIYGWRLRYADLLACGMMQRSLVIIYVE